MNFPIMAIDGYDIIFYQTLEEAERDIEPYDVDVYLIFDREGFVLSAKIMSKKVTIVQNEDHPRDSNELKFRLFHYLRLSGIPEEELSGLTLDDLVKKAYDHYSA